MLSVEESKEYLKKFNLTDKQVEQFRNAAYSISTDISCKLLTTKEYRDILNDYESSDEQIKKRLDYLEGFCRNIIRQELQPKNGQR